MSTLDDIAREKQRIAERLARVDNERAKLAEQLSELETTERVLSRFGDVGKPRRGRPPRRLDGVSATAAGGTPGRRRPTVAVAAKEPGLSLGDATLRAVEAHGDGVSAPDIRTYLASEFGMAVRPNHLGMALQRHRRAGRLESRGSLWLKPQQSAEEQPPGP